MPGTSGTSQALLGLDRIRDLVRLAQDPGDAARIGDLIWSARVRDGKVQLPGADVVRRRLSLGADPAQSGETFGQAWDAWLAGKKRLRASSRRRLEQIGEHWLKPAVADVPLERFGSGHCAAVFDRVERINAEIEAAHVDGRKPRPEGDVRTRPLLVGIATQHRIYAALREVLNHLWKKEHKIAYKPVYAVELEPEETPEADRWSAAEARRFLAYTEDKPLGLMFRTIVLRGARRGEAVGFRWASSDLDAGYLGVDRPILQIGGEVIEGKPKTKGSERKVWLDAVSVDRYRTHRKAQLAARLRASTAWQDNDLIFCREDGSPWPPDQVSRIFKRYAAEAGVRVIKLHEGRHTGASLARDAGVDPKIRQEQLGHTTGAMTDHYTHVLAEQHLAAAEAVARLVGEAGS
ncbi:MAG TPA: site-specific integrase [Streptosporangiaceae bacterium]|nr:site-specific integrase [Streptosporangiaceae bacterium]